MRKNFSKTKTAQAAETVANADGSPLDEVPNERRAFLSFLFGAFSALGTGTVIMKVTGYAIIGAIMLTGSAFIAMCIWLLGLIAAIYYSLRTFGRAFDYVAKERIDHDIVRTREWIGAKYERITGLFVKKVPA